MSKKEAAKESVNIPATTENEDTNFSQISTASLREKLEDARKESEKTQETLRQKREYHLEQVKEIDLLLGEVSVTPTSTPRSKRQSASSEVPRSDGGPTIMEGVESLCLMYKDGLDVGQITEKMIKEIGYKPRNSDPEAFAKSVYTGGINKLVQDGTLIAIGGRPKVYKHLKNCTAEEVRMYKFSK